MSTESQNTSQVVKIFEAFGRGDIPSIVEQLSDDVRFKSHLDPVVPWAGEFSGKTEVLRYFQALGGSAEVAGHPVHSLLAQGDTVVATGDVTFRVRGTGKEGASSWVYIFKLAEGKVQSFEQFNDTGLRAAFC